MREPARPLAPAVAFGPFRIPGEVDLLFRDDTVVALEPRAVQVLRYLAERPGRVVPRRELLAGVWAERFVTDDVLKQAVAKARRALGERPDGGAWIETFHARGYLFAGHATAGEAAAAPPPDAAAVLAALRRAAAEVATAIAALAALADAAAADGARELAAVGQSRSP